MREWLCPALDRKPICLLVASPPLPGLLPAGATPCPLAGSTPKHELLLLQLGLTRVSILHIPSPELFHACRKISYTLAEQMRKTKDEVQLPVSASVSDPVGSKRFPEAKAGGLF